MLLQRCSNGCLLLAAPQVAGRQTDETPTSITTCITIWSLMECTNHLLVLSVWLLASGRSAVVCHWRPPEDSALKQPIATPHIALATFDQASPQQVSTYKQTNCLHLLNLNALIDIK